MTSLNKTQHVFKGVLFFITAIFFISVVDTICKLFTKELHAIQIVWGYFLGINLTLWIFFFLKGKKLSNLRTTDRPILQILRPAFLVCSISSLFVGLTYLPLAEATAIGFVAPLFITVLSVPILKEKVGIHRWAAVVVGLIGVLIERLVIRHLYGRPLETLLATFGISLLLQQLVRSIFSPINMPVISPQWMSGMFNIHPALSLSYGRLYILAFSIIIFIYCLRRGRERSSSCSKRV